MWMIILQIVMALANPALWKAVGDIWDKIKGLPKGAEKTAYVTRFRALLKECNGNICPVADKQAEFDALRKELGML